MNILTMCPLVRRWWRRWSSQCAPCSPLWCKLGSSFMTRISFIARPPYLSSMGLDDDPIHKDLRADEDMGDGVVWWWIAVFCAKKHWTYLDRLSIIWSDWSCGKALVCEPVAPEWDNNVLGDLNLTSYPFLCSTHVHCHCAQEVQTLTRGASHTHTHTHTQIQLPGLHSHPIPVIVLGTCTQQIPHYSY